MIRLMVAIMALVLCANPVEASPPPPEVAAYDAKADPVTRYRVITVRHAALLHSEMPAARQAS